MDKRWMPTVVGVLEIISSICAVFGIVALLFACGIMNTVPDIQEDSDVPLEWISGLLVTLAALLAVGGALSLIGGISSIRRRGWGWAVAGGVAAFFLVPPAGLFAVVLAIVAEAEYSDRSSSGPAQ
ncbi:MAG: hypothetical protein OES47_15465 [Acidobacteriota bacterium]|nr:hypothetical protein [Acidobacteriota bacterium]